MNIEEVNRSLFLALNAPAGLAGISLNLAIGAAKYSILVLIGILVWRWVLGKSDYRNVLIHVVVALVPALAINYAVGLVFFHPRPFMVGFGHSYLAHLPEASFPSDHATLMWTIAFGLLYWSPTRPSSWISLLLAALTSWARIFLGVHFPFDIAGSIVVALISVAALVPMYALTVRYVAKPIEAIYFFVTHRVGWR